MSAHQDAARSAPSTLVLATSIFLPFVSGYFLSYYFRVVNAVLSSRLAHDLDLDATSIGIGTSAYFFMAAAAQIPIGIALDRWGPRCVQVPCLAVAAAGALITSVADDFVWFFVGRALIGLGVASALMAGLKAIVLWFPRERIPLVNGMFIAAGSTGALAASLPTEVALNWLSWRELFQLLAGMCFASAACIWLCAPQDGGVASGGSRQAVLSLRAIYADKNFWRLAPLSATAIGTAWALQGLWAGPWLREVAHLHQSDVARHLLLMAVALSSAAVGFGIVVDRLRRHGVETGAVLAVGASVFIGAEIVVAARWSVHPLIPWSMIGAFGAATVLSYSLTAEWFDKSTIGRVNSALNILHFGFAFALQGAFGWILSYWPRGESGSYPPDAYKAALLLAALLQLVALLWFVRPVGSSQALKPTIHQRSASWQRTIAVIATVAAGWVVMEMTEGTRPISWMRSLGDQVRAHMK